MDVAEIILNKKPDIEAKNSHGQSALLVAVTYGYADVVRILLSHGAQVDAMHGSTGQTALIVAVQKGFLDVVEVLLDHGAEIDKKNKVQDSALSVAVMRKNPPMVKLILTRGADSAGLLQDAKNMGEVGKIDAHTLAMLRASDAFIFDPNSRFSSGVLKPPIGIS
jgi:ankyrin repeat protein